MVVVTIMIVIRAITIIMIIIMAIAIIIGSRRFQEGPALAEAVFRDQDSSKGRLSASYGAFSRPRHRFV